MIARDIVLPGWAFVGLMVIVGVAITCMAIGAVQVWRANHYRPDGDDVRRLREANPIPNDDPDAGLRSD